jgi:hypothetical protein
MADEMRLRAKQFAYELSDMVRWPGRRTPEQTRRYYSLAVYGCVPSWIPAKEQSWEMARNLPGLGPVPESWWGPYADLLPHLKLDAEPWQLDYCRRMIQEHPGIQTGLDSFGIA